MWTQKLEDGAETGMEAEKVSRRNATRVGRDAAMTAMTALQIYLRSSMANKYTN
jgi:hypothetical protein